MHLQGPRDPASEWPSVREGFQLDHGSGTLGHGPVATEESVNPESRNTMTHVTQLLDDCDYDSTMTTTVTTAITAMAITSYNL